MNGVCLVPPSFETCSIWGVGALYCRSQAYSAALFGDVVHLHPTVAANYRSSHPCPPYPGYPNPTLIVDLPKKIESTIEATAKDDVS